MFLKYMLFLVLTLPWFAGGKKPKLTTDTFANENKLTIQENSGCKGQFLHPDCSGRVILLDASSGSGLAGKGQGANTGGCVFKDGDVTTNFDIPDWILRDCNLKGSCDIPADRILNLPLYDNMEYVEIKYFCIDRKPVYDMCAPVTIQETSAYLISYGYPSMPFINDITDECECSGTLQKKTLFAYRLLDGDLRSFSPGQRDCDPAQRLEISSKSHSKTLTCANQNAGRDFETINPKGGKDYAEIVFQNELEEAGGRFIFEYKHESGSFRLTCNPERVMPPTRPTTTTTTTQSTTTTTPPTIAVTTTPSPTTTTITTTTTTTPTTTTTKSTTTILAATTSIQTTTTEATSITPNSSTTKPLTPKTTQQKEATPTTGGSSEHTPTATASQQPASPFVEKDATTMEPTAKILNSKAQSKDTNLGMIIGVISAVVVLAVVAIILFICIRRRKSNSKLDRKMSEVDLVETEPSSDVYCNPAATLQTRFNTNSVENDYSDASPPAGTMSNSDSEYSNYSSVNPMYGLNTDSGEDYSVIENKYIRFKESGGSFGTESNSDPCGTNVPVYAVVNKNKNKKQDVPLHAQVNKNSSAFESQVKGDTGEVMGKVDEGGSYSFENPMIGNESVPDQGLVHPGLSDKMTDPVAEDVYHMVDDEAPEMTYSLEEGVPSAYALEEPVGQGANEYLDILPDPVDVQSQATGVHAKEFTTQKFGNGQTGFASWNPVGPSNTKQFNGDLKQKGGQPVISQNTNVDGGETDGEYVYTYSHFPKNMPQNGQGGGTNGYIGRPVISEPGSVSQGSPSPPGKARQTGTEPEYALYDAGDTYTCIEDSHTDEGEAGGNGASLSQGQGQSQGHPSPGTDPTYFLYDEGGGQGADDEEYHYIPTEGPTGVEEQEDDIYHEL